MITLETGQDYPVCVAFGGNSPAEYPSGDEPEEPEPFDQAAVNTGGRGANPLDPALRSYRT